MRSFWNLEDSYKKIAGAARLKVNSLHWQGVDKLGDGLSVEARAPDGVIEAFSVAGSRTFSMGLQWHPEWQFAKDPFSRALFGGLGTASRQCANGAR